MPYVSTGLATYLKRALNTSVFVRASAQYLSPINADGRFHPLEERRARWKTPLRHTYLPYPSYMRACLGLSPTDALSDEQCESFDSRRPAFFAALDTASTLDAYLLLVNKNDTMLLPPAWLPRLPFPGGYQPTHEQLMLWAIVLQEEQTHTREFYEEPFTEFAPPIRYASSPEQCRCLNYPFFTQSDWAYADSALRLFSTVGAGWLRRQKLLDSYWLGRTSYLRYERNWFSTATLSKNDKGVLLRQISPRSHLAHDDANGKWVREDFLRQFALTWGEFYGRYTLIQIEDDAATLSVVEDASNLIIGETSPINHFTSSV